MENITKRRRVFNIGFIVLVVIINLAIGLFGGVVGYSIMANSNYKWAQNLRKNLGISSSSTLALPVKSTYQIEESSATIDAAQKVLPAVVSISGSQQVTDFFGQISTQQAVGGTGFILTSDGIIVTNKHVISTPGTYKVVLDDGRIFDATILTQDPLNDLAFLKINAQNLPTAQLGSSSSLKVGQFVEAIGNALGQFNNSVSLGIVSATNRSISASDSSSTKSESLTGLIQTDATINPGNSGGPLINLEGQVVGIDTAIASTSGGSVGIGFAIPIDSIQNVISSVLKTGKIVRPYLGVRYIPVDKSIQSLDNLTVNYGALVAPGQTAGEVAVLPGSPADKAGLQANDIILEINGVRVDQTNTLSSLIANYNVGDTISVTYLRQGQQHTVKVTLQQLQ
jgi:serine protease Do